MKLYKIKGWNEYFENNRSRDLKSLSWVLVPNRHDGENYSAIVSHENGGKIFSAWILMIQVASKCDPRGTLLRGNKEPHTAVSLSIKTRAPVDWFTLAFEYLESNTDWLVVTQFSDSPAKDVITPQEGAGFPQVPDEERREGKGIERTELGDGGRVLPKWEFAVRWLADWRNNGADYTEEEARSAFLALEASGWMWGRNPVADPRAALERQIQTDRSRNQRGYGNNQKDSKPNPRNNGIATNTTEQGKRIANKIASRAEPPV